MTLSAVQAQNRVLQLDGDGDYVQLPANVFNHLEEATVEAWVRWEAFDHYSHWFSYGTIAGPEGKPALMGFAHANSAPTFRFYMYVPYQGLVLTQASTDLPAGQWCHMAGVLGSAGTRLYLNGVLVAEHPFEGGFAALGVGDAFYLGRSHWAINRDFRGSLDEVRVWSVARSAEQIRAAMYERLEGTEDDLAALWNFDAGDAHDSGPSALHGRLVGDAVCVDEALPAAADVHAPTALVGSLKDASGNAALMAKVRLERADLYAGDALADATGTFRLWLFGQSPYDLGVESANGDWGLWQLDRPLEKRAERLDLVIPPVNSLSGRVLDLRPKVPLPLAGVVLEALRLGKDVPQVRQMVHSDKGGYYRFENLKPGAYMLRCHLTGGYAYYTSASGGNADTLVVEAGTVRNDLDFRSAPLKKGRWKRYGVLEGFTDNVRYITQDDEGFLWLATKDGAWRFDGKRFDRLGTGEGLVHDDVHTVYKDRDGGLWFGTAGGVSRYDGRGFLSLDCVGLQGQTVSDILQDRSGTIWLAAPGGVWRSDGRSCSRMGPADGFPATPVRRLLETDAGELLLATERSVSRYKDGEALPFSATPLIHHSVFDMIQDRSGAVWFATRRGVSRYAAGVFSTLVQSGFGASV